MKRYALFASETYYPWGGWGDFYDAFDSVEEALVQLGTIPDERARQEWHIVDLEVGQVVKHEGGEWGDGTWRDRWHTP